MHWIAVLPLLLKASIRSETGYVTGVVLERTALGISCPFINIMAADLFSSFVSRIIAVAAEFIRSCFKMTALKGRWAKPTFT
jgi:hypothetical protein